MSVTTRDFPDGTTEAQCLLALIAEVRRLRAEVARMEREERLALLERAVSSAIRMDEAFHTEDMSERQVEASAEFRGVIAEFNGDLPKVPSRMALLEAVADLVRRKQCCDGQDAETTEEALAAIAALDAGGKP
jgi:hypothetical protein